MRYLLSIRRRFLKWTFAFVNILDSLIYISTLTVYPTSLGFRYLSWIELSDIRLKRKLLGEKE